MNQSNEQPKITGKGGKRPGAGRKKGKKTAKTLEREAILKAFRERAMKHADILFDAQLTLARGQTFLFKIEKELQIGPKGGKRYVSSRPKLVTTQSEIEDYLAGTIESGNEDDENDPQATYYYITGKEPNNQAIDALLDRTFGKAVNRTELTGKDGGDLFPPEQVMEKAKKALIDFKDSVKSPYVGQ